MPVLAVRGSTTSVVECDWNYGWTIAGNIQHGNSVPVYDFNSKFI